MWQFSDELQRKHNEMQEKKKMVACGMNSPPRFKQKQKFVTVSTRVRLIPTAPEQGRAVLCV